MRGHWKRCGRIYTPPGDKEWSLSHAANPTALPLGKDLVRVYFSTRDRDNRSYVRCADFQVGEEGAELVEAGESPVLTPGDRGYFDDCGVTPGCVVKDPETGQIRLYYLGWNLATTVPWRNFIGLAVSDDGGETFRKYSRAPVLDRSEADPFSVSYPWVEIDDQGKWVMWYGTNLTWGETTDDMIHALRRAVSDDGISWKADPEPCLMPRLDDGETAVSRPSIVRRDNEWKMWASGKPVHYEMVFASSDDQGVTWQFSDEGHVLSPSGEGWDSSEVCYPNIFESGEETWMLYCGDGYGKTGFGLAKWINE